MDMKSSIPLTDAQTDSHPHVALGAVSYLNSRPLVEGLDHRPGVTMRYAVPSALAALLDRGEVDAALLPVVDFARRRDRLRLVSDGCIGCDGETLTVRVFAKAPPDRIARVFADADSHTSVVLVRLVWRMLYERTLTLLPRPAGTAGPASDLPDFDARTDALLLIGDKVVTQRPHGYGFEVDLGAAWKHLTGLPMVFAAWATPRERFAPPRLEQLAALLSAARDAGVARASRIAEQEAAEHGWPIELARHYLTSALQFRLSEQLSAGMDRFLTLAETAGLLVDGQ